jgi:lipopolysaccharide biosynthesis protein
MRSICLFSSYFTGDSIPFYVRYYLEQLKPFFSEILFLTTEKNLSRESIQFLTGNSIVIRQYINEGMDFGMWQKALSEIDSDTYDRIALINDSCVLFKSPSDFFNWIKLDQLDFAGMVLSGKFTDHLQSFFLIINEKAIPHLKDFLAATGVLDSYKKIIFKQEIGLSEFMKSKSMRMDGYFNFSHRKDVNPSFILIDELIEMGSPLIKKKVFTRNFSKGDYLTWFRNQYIFDPNHYIAKIEKRNAGLALINFNRVMNELNGKVTLMQKVKYKSGQLTYNLLSKIAPLRMLFHKLISVKRSMENE